MDPQAPSAAKAEPIIPEIVFSPPGGDVDPRAEIEQLQRLARWMDSAIPIPGTKLSVGVDAILGLLPGVGDVASALISLHILRAAQRSGVSRLTMGRMASNVLLDSLFGSVPVAGDMFDVFWKANSKNVALLGRHLDADPSSRRRARRGDRLFFAAVVAGLILILVGSVSLTYLAVRWLMQ
jgi:hypothetical protein